MDIEMTLHLYEGGVLSVPMARGKHLFPYRTQQLSLAAVTILGAHPWENSTVPNYIKAIRIGWLLSFLELVVQLEGGGLTMTTHRPRESCIRAG